tara:strand:- start:379 stop:627 length:249 start_codon:yes stop_codon:yes gene_type:complete
MLDRQFVKNNIIFFSIICFLIIYISIIKIKPAFIFNIHGNLKQFGLRYKNKSVLPLWLISIVIAVISYLIILYCLAVPKMLE